METDLNINMLNTIQDIQLVIASVNGSGTLTSNRILQKILFREGYHVVGKNLFPSNIEGLPTYYFLRISKGFNTTRKWSDVYLALNPSTLDRDLKTLVHQQTLIFSNEDLKGPNFDSFKNINLSFKQSVKNSKASIKTKKRMSNMCYVGWLGRYLNLNLQTIKDVIHSHFSDSSVAQENIEVMLYGWNQFESDGLLPLKLDPSLKTDNSNQILIEGNQASALGWVDGGCTVATWYPITPSSSLVESFESYAKTLRPNPNHVAVVQSEDEISAVASVVGAGWAGARAATATSGPGLSLMSEALGLAYFAEVPAVVCDVQRVGPSTGLPTRTSQGDLEFAYKISHGDTLHPVLLPSNPEDCYQMNALAFDIADKYQTPVFVLSDLDLGMNLWTSKTLIQKQNAFDKSSVMSELDLEKLNSDGQRFKRYLGDEFGIPKRTLPGTHHPDAAYFTRGSGHNQAAGYSEHPEDYEILMTRLKTKILNSRNDLPRPIIHFDSVPMSNLEYNYIETDHLKNTELEHKDLRNKDIKNKILETHNLNTHNGVQNYKFGAIFYGTTAQIFPELNQLLNQELNVTLNTCLVQSLPLHDDVYQFINQHDFVFVIEQNRDGQLRNIILNDMQNSISQNSNRPLSYEQVGMKLNTNHLISITHFNGWSIQSDLIFEMIKKTIEQTTKHDTKDKLHNFNSRRI